MYGVLWCRWSSSSLVSQHVSSLLYNESFFVVLCGRIHPWCWNSWYCVKSTLRKQPTFCDTSGFPSKPTSFPGFSPTSPYGAREREGGGGGGGGRGVGERTWERGCWTACVTGVWNGRQREFWGARETRGARPCSLSPQTLFPNKRINSILMTHHYPDRVVLLIGRATREICFIHSGGLPRSGCWHVISMKFLRAFLWRHFAGKPVVASQNVGYLLRLHVREEKTSFSRAVLEWGKCPSAPENGTFRTDR